MSVEIFVNYVNLIMSVVGRVGGSFFFILTLKIIDKYFSVKISLEIFVNYVDLVSVVGRGGGPPGLQDPGR